MVGVLFLETVAIEMRDSILLENSCGGILI